MTIKKDCLGYEIVHETEKHHITKDDFNNEVIFCMYDKKLCNRFDMGLIGCRYSLEEAIGWVEFLEKKGLVLGDKVET